MDSFESPRPHQWHGVPERTPFWHFQITGWTAYAILSVPVKWFLFGSLSAVFISLYQTRKDLRELAGFLRRWVVGFPDLHSPQAP